MTDFNVILMLGTLASEAKFFDDKTAGFKICHSAVDYWVVTTYTYIIDKTINNYIIKDNIGKRLLINGTLVPGEKTIAPSRIQFIDAFLSKEQVAMLQENEIPFDDDDD